jgi:xylan 1,4-beta-xylosidase
MKKIVSTLILFTLVLHLNSQSPSFQTYMNPVIPGDHPDCTLTKVGNDFYTTGSSFNVTPVIYHSTDLVHWEAIAQPVSASWSIYDDVPGGGCWGGQIVFYNGEYWDYFSRANIMYFVKANEPKGPWSEPTRVTDPPGLPYSLGYDNSVFIDENNKWYLVVKNGQPNNGIVELGNDGQPTGLVYDLNWLNPSPALPYSWAEGPVMWKYNDYYYYSFARDLAGGQKVMRSDTLTDDETSWEMLGDFFNENDPLKSSSLFASPNHASPAVLISDSTTWVVHPLYAKGEWKGQGRQGLLNQVRYNTSGRPVTDYPINQSFTAPDLPGSGIPWMVPKSDYFTEDHLLPEWSSLGYTPAGKYSLTEHPGWLRLSPKSSSKGNTMTKYDGEHNYSLITRLDFSPKSSDDQAGLRILRGDETKFVKLISSKNSEGKKVVIFSYENNVYEAENNFGDTLWLKMIRVNHKITGFFSDDASNWTQVGQAVDVSIIDSYSDFVSFTGTLQGLYVQGAVDAYFDLYIYRDALTPILAECPANQFGTSRSSLSQGIRALNNIHNNDWALYAGVEFGNNEYYDAPDSVEFTASSDTDGGIVQVWLDSINTGTLIAECTIGNTGSLTEYKEFKSAITPVTGNHDVYLKFTGDPVAKLFQLKWITFTPKPNIINSSETIKLPGKLSLYPNPAKTHLSIQSGFLFHTVEIFNMNGQSVLLNHASETDCSSLDFNLAEGLYLVKISSDKNVACSKLMINL